MRTAADWLLLVLGVAGAWALTGKAQDVAEPATRPWRPIPELPALLWYTEFDETADEAKKFFKNGAIVSQDPFKPDDDAAKRATGPPWHNDRYIALKKAGWGKDEDRKVSFSIKLDNTRLRVPENLDPNRIFLQFDLWASQPGQVTVMVKAGISVSGKMTVPRPNQWYPLKVSFGALTGEGERMKPESLAREIRFTFAPSRAGTEWPEVCIDKVLLCHQVSPDRIAPLLQAWQAMLRRLTRRLPSDGFCYNEKIHATLRKLTRQGNHRGPVLVFLPPLNANADLVALFDNAAREAGLQGTRFEAARDARTFAISGLEDARAFLPYLLARVDPKAVLLVIAREDAALSGKELESLRLILDRLLTAHCPPLLCLPAADGTDRTLAEFLKAAVKLCEEMGVPYADQGFAFKGIARPYQDGTLTVEGQRAVCALLFASYKHIQDALDPQRQ